MLARPAQLAKVNSNWTDRRHPVFGLSGSPKKQRRSSQKGSDSQGKGEVLRKFLEKPGKISQASSTGSEEIIPRNYYRNRKNIERRKMKKLQRGMTPEDDKVKNLNESILFCEIKNARNNTKNRNPMRMSKTRSQDKYLTLTGRRGLLSGINKEGNQKEINLTNQNKSALVEMDDI